MRFYYRQILEKSFADMIRASEIWLALIKVIYKFELT